MKSHTIAPISPRFSSPRSSSSAAGRHGRRPTRITRAMDRDHGRTTTAGALVQAVREATERFRDPVFADAAGYTAALRLREWT